MRGAAPHAAACILLPAGPTAGRLERSAHHVRGNHDGSLPAALTLVG
jgi:hypothetical protein